MDNEKQNYYNDFIAKLALEGISLKSHIFLERKEIEKGKTIDIKIDNRIDSYAFEDSKLILNYVFNIKAEQKSGESEFIVWQADYLYQVMFNTPRELFDEIIKDEELKKVFEHKQMVLFLWPYLRQEVQADTQKANVPGLVLPPRT